MKQSVNLHTFRESFRTMGRHEQFSWQGLEALFDYLEELEDAIGDEVELDVIALCCDYSEHYSACEAAQEYGWSGTDRDEDESEEDYSERAEDEALEWLRDRTSVIEVSSGSVIIQGF
jgi:hypothetical protein